MKEIICKEIISEAEKGFITNKSQLDKLKKQLGKKYQTNQIPTNPDILIHATDEQITKFRDIFHIKPTRTISGVGIITVVCKPGPCGGACVYCPWIKGAPHSYSGLEPAVARGKRNQYNPYKQVVDRLNQLRIMAHPHDKLDIIILGGTFLALPVDYQEWFIQRMYEGLNRKPATSIEEAKKVNETAKYRCIGLTIETRPDFCKQEHIDRMLSYGTTRVEIGVQSIYPKVLKLTNRLHTVEDVVDSIQIAKDAGFKVVLHMMPGLPGSDTQKDVEMFKILFSDERFMPDDLKIYPTMVLPNTKLYDMWKQGEYDPLTNDQTRDILVEIKKITPPYVRLRRIFRDIPVTETATGPNKSNMRELAMKKLDKLGIRCRCTRCREVGHVKKRFGLEPTSENIKLVRREYDASGGREIFLSFEDVKQDILISLLRLRIPSEKTHRPEISEATIVREIHTYGPLVPIDKQPKKEWQHRGYGKELLAEAERISKEDFGAKKIIVIAGVGVKQWFLKQGYRYDWVYVSKDII